MTGKLLRPGDERDILAAYFEVEKEDIFHIKNMYKYMHEYLVYDGWYDIDPVEADKWEHYYWEKRMQNGLREQRVWWRFQQKPKDNQYMRYVVAINFRHVYVKKLEIIHKGQKVGTWSGDVTLLIEAYVQLDYQNKWKDHWLLKHIDNLYRKRIYRSQWDKAKKDLWREMYKFQGYVKQYLEMKVPFEQPEAFHPISGVGPNPRREIAKPSPEDWMQRHKF
ncbi:hypothetical protein ACFL1B_01730 [Nanoarchaeota archaeon]